MKPYYDDGGVTIYHGDCKEILPTLGRVDLLMTDPPYGIGAARNQRANKKHGAAAVASRDYGASDWDDAPPPRWLIEQSIEMARYAVVWGGNHLGLPASPCWLVWDKDNGNNGYADCELAWTNLPQAVRRIKWRWAGMLQERMGKDKEERVHPTQKPVALMTFCLNYAKAEPNWAVLDPFMGSGTTLVACRKAGIKSVGIDAEEKYCEIAAQRVAQMSLFEDAA
jgi:DNA modification methylase